MLYKTNNVRIYNPDQRNLTWDSGKEEFDLNSAEGYLLE